MADNINICGEGTLKNDLDTFLKGIFSPAVMKALDDVGADMQSALAKHIETDVYPKYRPRMYERRGEDGGLIAQAREAKIYNHGNGVAIDFKPDGTHPTVSGWSKVHGDDLVGRIESHNPEYTWRPKNGNIPNRPFWQNYVSEMIDDNTVEYYFVSAMRRRDFELVEDGDLSRESADGTY